MGLWSATSIGVGAMIGAGIFALVGLAVQISGQMAFLSFAFAGIIALLTAYSVSRLAVAFPSKGGKVTFLKEGFGNGILSGGLNITMWVGYIIVTALYTRAFGEYGAALVGMEGNSFVLHLLSSAVAVLFILINFAGASLVGKSEFYIVLVKVIILLLFGIIGLTTINLQRFSLSEGFEVSDIILAGGIVFMSYEGFGLVANTAEDINNPRVNLPRALFLSILLVIFIYLLVSSVVIGNLSIPEILRSREYVLAEAAVPILGSLGFTIMGIAALFSTASAINATIYGPVYMLQVTSEMKQLPGFFKKSLFGHKSGIALLVTGSVVLIISNVLSLESIAETGSLIFLLIYSAINIANLRLYKKTHSKRWIIWIAVAGTIFSFSALAYFLWRKSNISVYVLAGILFVCFVYEWVFQSQKRKKSKLTDSENINNEKITKG